MSTTQAKLIYLHAITPVHSGTGQAADVIDQPIAREKATGWPMIPASSLKGVLRDLVKANHGEDKAKELFGDPDKAGPVVFGDQRILCLPVRSFFGTFAYVTSPLVLQRLKRDLEALGMAPPFTSEIPESSDSLTVFLPVDNSVLVSGKVYLEDLDLTVARRKETGEIAAGIARALFGTDGKEFTSRFAIVSDEVFNFLSETATEVVARIAIGEEGTTSSKGGNLWYEEAVPSETIFCGPVIVADYYAEKAKLIEDFDKALKPTQQQGASNSQPITIQIGGNASVGRGLCRVVMQ
jgi:CRISPR-associated protein Cmr4